MNKKSPILSLILILVIFLINSGCVPPSIYTPTTTTELEATSLFTATPASPSTDLPLKGTLTILSRTYLYRMNIDGTQQGLSFFTLFSQSTPIKLQDIGGDFSLSPDNQQFVSAEGHDLVIRNISDGSVFINIPREVYAVQEPLTSGGDIPYIRDIVWMPDGKRIMFFYDHNIPYTMNGDGSNLSHFGTVSVSTKISWSPNGEYIATICDYCLCMLDKNGNLLRKLFVPQDMEYYADLDWSPDGNLIAYSASEEINGNFDIYLVDVSGNSAPKNITHTESLNEGHLAWSPDGHTIMFVGDYYSLIILDVDRCEKDPTKCEDTFRNLVTIKKPEGFRALDWQAN